MKTRLALLVVSLSVFVGIGASMGFADPDLGFVPAHRHYVQLVPSDPSSAWVPVGPDLCDNLSNAGIEKAFREFHNNVHNGGGTVGGLPAPGLHDTNNATIKSGRC
jgi:hypothetical protein